MKKISLNLLSIEVRSENHIRTYNIKSISRATKVSSKEQLIFSQLSVHTIKCNPPRTELRIQTIPKRIHHDLNQARNHPQVLNKAGMTHIRHNQYNESIGFHSRSVVDTYVVMNKKIVRDTHNNRYAHYSKNYKLEYQR